MGTVSEFSILRRDGERRARLSLFGRVGSLIILTVACLFPQLSFGAVMRDVFTVRQVPVDITADTAAAARVEAIRRGQRAALNFLFERLVLRSDEESLPLLTDDEVTALVQGFEVGNEKTSSTRYLANLTIKFKKKSLRNMLRRERIPFTETVAKPLLVLPVLAIGSSRVLWDDPNPWRRAWSVRARPDDGLLPFVVPHGDLEDLSIIDADLAIQGDETALSRIARRYGAEEVMVAHAAISFEDLAAVPTVQVVLRRHGPLGERVVVEQFGGRQGDQIPELLEWVANAISVDLEEEWKALTLLDFGTKFALDARVPLSALQDWLTIRRLLAESAVVQKSELRALSTLEARVAIEFVGNSQGLVVALAQRDLDLAYNNGLWTLNLRKDQEIESAITPAEASEIPAWLRESQRLEAEEQDAASGLGINLDSDPPGGMMLEEIPEYRTLELEGIILNQDVNELDEPDPRVHPSIRTEDGYSTNETGTFVPLSD